MATQRFSFQWLNGIHGQSCIFSLQNATLIMARLEKHIVVHRYVAKNNPGLIKAGYTSRQKITFGVSYFLSNWSYAQLAGRQRPIKGRLSFNILRRLLMARFLFCEISRRIWYKMYRRSRLLSFKYSFCFQNYPKD